MDLKIKLKQNKNLIGTWSMIPSSFVADVITTTEVDFVIIDLEHGTANYETCENIVRSIENNNKSPIIRVGSDDENIILRAMETGCNSIMIPHVSNSAQAKKIVNYTKYKPIGKRGLSSYTRCHDYDHENIDKKLSSINKKITTGILVEGKEGIDNLDEITKVNGIDLVYLGLYDIAQSLDLSGNINHPKVKNKIIECYNIIKKNKKYSGIFANNLNDVKKFKKIGFNFIAYVADSHAIRSFYKNFFSQLKK